MPWIIVKKALTFFEDTIGPNPQTGQIMQVITDQITVYPNIENIPVEVPEWAEYDELFDLCVADGSVIIVSERSAKATLEKQRKKEEQEKSLNQEKKPVGLQGGWTKK